MDGVWVDGRWHGMVSHGMAWDGMALGCVSGVCACCVSVPSPKDRARFCQLLLGFPFLAGFLCAFRASWRGGGKGGLDAGGLGWSGGVAVDKRGAVGCVGGEGMVLGYALSWEPALSAFAASEVGWWLGTEVNLDRVHSETDSNV